MKRASLFWAGMKNRGPHAAFTGRSWGHPAAMLFFVVLLVSPVQAGVDVLLAGATEAELAPVLAKLSGTVSAPQAGWQFWTGTYAGKTVAVARTEGDPLNAVAATTLAIRRYQPKLVVSFGTARAHDPALKPGDVVISAKFVPFDGMVSEHTDLGEGSKIERWHKLLHPMITPGEKETAMETFAPSADALKAALTLQPATGKLVAGALGSAYQVNREVDRIAWLRATWGTSCEDAESAPIAGCAYLLGTPAFGLRVIEGESVKSAAEASAGLALRLLEVLP